MSAGELRELLAFDSIGDQDADGGRVPGVWTEQFQRRARVKPLRGSEPVIAQRLVGVQPFLVTVRASTEAREITTGWRARDVRTGAIYQIRTVVQDEKRKYIELTCESGSPVEEGS